MSADSLPVDIDLRMFLFSAKINEIFLLCFVAIFGFSNHLYGEQYAFEKTRLGCRLLEKIMVDLTDNYRKMITDEKELIRQTLSLLNDATP